MAKKVSRFREMADDDELTKRTEQSYNTRESSGKFNDYFTDDMPLTKWFCGDGSHILDVIPFIAGPKHPNVKEGKPTHNVDVFVHFGIGVTESAYICPARMGIGPCPICEYQNELKKQKNYDEDFVKSFNAKRRVVYNVLVYDTPKDEDAGVMIWEASHHLAEKNIMAIARNNRTGGFIKWASPDVGKTIEFSREGKGDKTRYVGFKFSDRDKPISDDILDDAIPIDEYLKIHTYEELKEILGSPSVRDEPLEERPTRASRASKAEQDNEAEQEQEQEQEPETRPRTKRQEVEPEEETEPTRVRRGRRVEPEAVTEEPETEPETGTTLRRRRR